jgi:cyanophycinase
MLRLTIAFFAITFLSFHTYAQGKLFIIGGGDRPATMLKRLMDEANLKENDYIIILPMASAEQDSSIYYATKQFTNLGFDRIKGYFMKKGEQLLSHQTDSIAHASVIYITGGDQARFMDIVAGTPVEKAIHACFQKGNLIAGTSAGAAVMSEKMITGNELKYKGLPDDANRPSFETIEANNIEITKGLGFIKTAIIDQHFIVRKRENRLLSVAIENAGTLCIGIDEATAILVKGNQCEVVGNSQVMVIKSNARYNKTANNKLASKNLKLDIYLEGDVFSLK